MKEFIIGFIIAYAIFVIIGLVFNMINDIIQSNKWSKTKDEIVEYLKTLGKSEVIGYSNNVYEVKITMTDYEIKEDDINILVFYSSYAKCLDKVFDWEIDDNTLIYKITEY